MKKLTILMLLLPTLAMAQSEQPKTTQSTDYARNEFSIKAGTAYDIVNSGYQKFWRHTTALSYNRNFKNFQIGLNLEAGVNPKVSSFFSPTASFNHLFRFNKSYVYGGITLGYITTSSGEYIFADNSNGFVLGAQAGYVYNFSKHFSLNAEVGLRDHTEWYNTTGRFTDQFGNVQTVPLKMMTNRISLPVMVGIRYRF